VNDSSILYSIITAEFGDLPDKKLVSHILRDHVSAQPLCSNVHDRLSDHAPLLTCSFIALKVNG
jgi:hypothetical protein